MADGKWNETVPFRRKWGKSRALSSATLSGTVAFCAMYQRACRNGPMSHIGNVIAILIMRRFIAQNRQ
jgi:hypothetical protein